MLTPKQQQRLCRAALQARRKAHAPYSNFQVGAAILTRKGDIITGCNVENSTYGLTVCAERIAVFKAISEGKKEFTAIAIAGPGPISPCGACRQILWEFCGDVPVLLVDPRGGLRTYRMSELFPVPFDDSTLEKSPVAGRQSPVRKG